MRSDYFSPDMLKDKVVVITGGTKGIGKAVILEAAKFGADIVFGARDQKAADEVTAQIESFGRKAVFVKIDLHNTDDIARLFDAAMNTFGKVDCFINYSGITPAASLIEETPEQYDDVMALNTRAAFFAAQNAIKCMLKNENGGSILFFGSPHAWVGEPDRVAYAVSKGALLTLSEHIAHHYAKYRIRANYITTGWTPTEGELALRKGQGMTIDDLREFAKPFIPIGRMSEVEDHVAGVLYLMSDSAFMVTGANLRVTGGFYI